MMSQYGLIVIPRRKNLDSLAYLGLIAYQMEKIIKELDESNYVSGPETDHDGSTGEIWKFKVRVEECEVYIKLKLDGTDAKCLSFHT